MGSRLKQNPERTFNWFFEATCPVVRDKDPGVLFQFPEDFSDEESCQTLPRFCFPYDIQRVRDGKAVQHFTFVLTDIEGCQRFGFCRLTSSTQTCLCILSYLPWFEVFYKLLNNLADYLTKGQTNETRVLLAALYAQSIPLAAGSVTLQMGEQLLVSTAGHPENQEVVPYFIAPDPKSLPSIPENRNLTELIVAVDVGNLLQVYASMLFERRILIFASKLSTLTSCAHALSALLYPMYWQHIFIPVLPPHLLDYCCAPMPYLIGVHSSLSERVRSRGLEEVVILNVDTNTLETPFDDIKKIPSDVMSRLKACLKRQAVSPGCGVSKAFLKAQALLFGGYRDALQGLPDGEIRFSEDQFLDHKSSSVRQFLQSAIHLQFFKQFIDDRLDILNRGEEPNDLFEEEILKSDSTGRSKSYQHLVGNLKKGGGALILNMKSRANLRAKDLARSGLRNLLMHKTQNEKHTLQRGGSVSHRRAQSDCLQSRLPITQHFGMDAQQLSVKIQILHRLSDRSQSRPRRPVHKLGVTTDMESGEAGDAWDGAVSAPVVGLDSDLQKDEEDDSLLVDPEEMDLLGEIFDTLSTRSSHDRGMLYGTRSLDLFGPDSHDYITKRGPANPSQESLSLSISGSGSLHSWNLETTEEASDLTEDSDWLSLDTSAPDQEGPGGPLVVCDTGEQEDGQREAGEKQEVLTLEVNGNQGEGKDAESNSEEVNLEGEKKTENPENRVSFREGLVEAAQHEDEGLEDKREDESNQSEIDERERTRKITNALLTGEGEENVGEKSKGTTEYLNKLMKVNPQHRHHSSTVEEHQEQEDALNVKTADSLEVQSSTLTVDREKRDDGGAVVKNERETGMTHSPPQQPSAVVGPRPPVSGKSLQVKPRIRGLAEAERPCNIFRQWENIQTHPSCGTNAQSEASSCSKADEEGGPPPVKVSELKKRFEA